MAAEEPRTGRRQHSVGAPATRCVYARSSSSASVSPAANTIYSARVALLARRAVGLLPVDANCRSWLQGAPARRGSGCPGNVSGRAAVSRMSSKPLGSLTSTAIATRDFVSAWRSMTAFGAADVGIVDLEATCAGSSGLGRFAGSRARMITDNTTQDQAGDDLSRGRVPLLADTPLRDPGLDAFGFVV